MKTAKFLYKLLFIVVIVFSQTSCESSDSAPEIMGIKVAGNGWVLKQTLKNKGFSIIKEEADAFVMEGKYKGEDLCYVCIMTGKWNKVMLASFKMFGFSLDTQYRELEKEYNTLYGTPNLCDNTDFFKTRRWMKSKNNEKVAEVELKGELQSYESGVTIPPLQITSPFDGSLMTVGEPKPLMLSRMTEINIVAYNNRNIIRYSKESQRNK